MALAVRVSNVYYCSNNNNKCVGLHCSRTKIYAFHMQPTMRIARRYTALLLPLAAPGTDRRTLHRFVYTYHNMVCIRSLCWASYLGSQHDAARIHSSGACGYWLIDSMWHQQLPISAACARAQQQTSHTSLLLSIDGTDRQTPTISLHILHCILCWHHQ